MKVGFLGDFFLLQYEAATLFQLRKSSPKNHGEGTAGLSFISSVSCTKYYQKEDAFIWFLLSKIIVGVERIKCSDLVPSV